MVRRSEWTSFSFSQVSHAIVLTGPTSTTSNSVYIRNGNNALGYDVTWDATKNWMGSTTETPGFYLLVDGLGKHATLAFDPPITAFLMRAVTYPVYNIGSTFSTLAILKEEFESEHTCLGREQLCIYRAIGNSYIR